jgi:NAD(P)-dependent dehydrogenase (short-subunit alcohol dehydrogenase family)
MEGCVQVNFLAAWRLIRTCGPVLAASDAGRAVFVTSSVARKPRAYWGAYAATKAAMESLVRCWADEVENTPLRVNLFDPGATATRMRAAAFPGEDPRTLKPACSRAEELVALCLPGLARHGELLRAA